MQELESEVEVLYKHVVYQQASIFEISKLIISGSITTKRIYIKLSDSNWSNRDTIALYWIQPNSFKVEKPEKYNSQSK